MKTDMKKYGLVFSMVTTAGLGLTACDMPEPAVGDDGEVIARFNSIWQRQADGRWLVVFDKGSPPDPATK